MDDPCGSNPDFLGTAELIVLSTDTPNDEECEISGFSTQDMFKYGNFVSILAPGCTERQC